MAINYPTSIDPSVGPGPLAANRGTTTTNDTTFHHGVAHQDISDAIVALETFAGIPLSAVTSTLEYRLRKFPFYSWIAGLEGSPSASNYAVFGMSNARPHLAFNDTVTNTTLFFGKVPTGAILTSGVIIGLHWKSLTVTTGSALWGVALERFTTDETADSFDTQGTALTATAGATSVLVTTAITLTSIDSIAAGDWFTIQVQRLGADGTDTLVGDACLRYVTIVSAA